MEALEPAPNILSDFSGYITWLKIIPAMGINRVLENVLASFCEDLELRTWSIYHEKNGCVNIKIRFDGCLGVPKRDVVYKKKSPGQVARDRYRSDQWRLTKPKLSDSVLEQSVQHHAVSPVQPKSQSDNNIAHMTRSKSKANNESIEIPRYNTEKSDALSPGHTLHMLNLFATPYVMEPDIHDDSHSPGSLCVPELVMPVPETRVHDSSPEESHMDCSPVRHEDITSEDDTSSDISRYTAYSAAVGCNMYYCMYCNSTNTSLMDHSQDAMYVCVRCDNVSVCQQCLDGGGHGCHRQYMIPRTNYD